MLTKLSGTKKAAIFTGLVLLLALATALYIRANDITSGFAPAWYMCTPALAILIMLLVVTRDGYSREGWKTLGLHRAGLKAWWISVLVTALVSVVATAIVWATPSLSSSCPTTPAARSSASSYSSSSLPSRFPWARSSDGGATCSPNS